MNWFAVEQDATHIVRLEGRFDAHSAPEIAAWLAQSLTMSPERIVVNLNQVPFIDSAALAVLVDAYKRCAAQGSQLVIACPSQSVRIILELTRLDLVLPTTATEADAVAFQAGAVAWES